MRHAHGLAPALCVSSLPLTPSTDRSFLCALHKLPILFLHFAPFSYPFLLDLRHTWTIPARLTIYPYVGPVTRLRGSGRREYFDMERGAGGGAGERTLLPLEQLEFQLSPSDRQKNNGREAQPAIGAVGGLRWTVPCRAGNPGTRRQGRRRCHRRLRRTRAFRTCSPWCRSPSAGRRGGGRQPGTGVGKPAVAN